MNFSNLTKHLSIIINLKNRLFYTQEIKYIVRDNKITSKNEYFYYNYKLIKDQFISKKISTIVKKCLICHKFENNVVEQIILHFSFNKTHPKFKVLTC